MSQITADRLSELDSRLRSLRAEMRSLRAAQPPQPVGEYRFATLHGGVGLAELFGTHDDLFIVHNMGRSCSYCTLWADGYNGLYPHIASRAAFVLVSPDTPEQQRSFAADRGWRFPMVSDAGTSFAADMGYVGANGGRTPGISALRRNANGIVRLADTPSSPGDDFCPMWHFLDLLPEGATGWSPRFRYG